MKSKPITDQIVTTIRTFIDEGLSARDISKKIDCTGKHIYNNADKLGKAYETKLRANGKNAVTKGRKHYATWHKSFW